MELLKFILLFCLLVALVVADFPSGIIWNGRSFPNPQFPEDFDTCKVSAKAGFCDPDGIFTKEARENIIGMLEMLQKITAKEDSDAACENQGIAGGVAVAEHFFGGNSEVNFLGVLVMLKFSVVFRHSNPKLKIFYVDGIWTQIARSLS